jgi:hypothetical protein
MLQYMYVHCSGWAGVNRGASLTQQLQSQLPDRLQLAVGVGRVTEGRRGLFRQQQGLAVEIVSRVYDIPACNGEAQQAEQFSIYTAAALHALLMLLYHVHLATLMQNTAYVVWQHK